MTTPEPHPDAETLAEEAEERRTQRGDTDEADPEVVTEHDLGE